jgi:succinate dehydrogenase/fumarate reductase cytochrome b subunit
VKLTWLLLIVPLFLVAQTLRECFKWLTSGSAGIEGYEYARSEEPVWYWLTITGSVVLIGFYLFIGLLLYIEVRSPGARFGSFIDVLILLMLVAQESGLSILKKRASA